jgi:hypothetical protein
MGQQSGSEWRKASESRHGELPLLWQSELTFGQIRMVPRDERGGSKDPKTRYQ